MRFNILSAALILGMGVSGLAYAQSAATVAGPVATGQTVRAATQGTSEASTAGKPTGDATTKDATPTKDTTDKK